MQCLAKFDNSYSQIRNIICHIFDRKWDRAINISTIMKQTPDHFDTAVAGWLYGCYLAPVSDKSFYCRPIISQSIDAPRFAFKIVGNWQTHRQQCCRHACQISKQYNNSSYQCRGFEISQDVTIRRGPAGYQWIDQRLPYLYPSQREDAKMKP